MGLIEDFAKALEQGGKVATSTFESLLRPVGDGLQLGINAANTTRWLMARVAEAVAQFVDPRAEITRNDVFLVHGHDQQLLDETIAAVAGWGLNPIVLSKLAGGTLTIKEKLRKHATRPTVGFAVVMLTADDACACSETPYAHKRARQNAVYELGYFMGMFAGERCCVLVRGKPEGFTDIAGISQIDVDQQGRWRALLRAELLAANVPLQHAKPGG